MVNAWSASTSRRAAAPKEAILLLGQEHGLAAISPLDENGVYLDGFGWLSGRYAGEVAEEVIGDLKTRGLLYRAAKYTHRYPVCWRCGSVLVFR